MIAQSCRLIWANGTPPPRLSSNCSSACCHRPIASCSRSVAIVCPAPCLTPRKNGSAELHGASPQESERESGQSRAAAGSRRRRASQAPARATEGREHPRDAVNASDLTAAPPLSQCAAGHRTTSCSGFAPGLPPSGHGPRAMRDQLCDNGGAHGPTVTEVHGRSLSVKDHFQACVQDLIRQRSVVQVHLGPPARTPPPPAQTALRAATR